MRRHFARIILCLAGVILLAPPASAVAVATCAADFSQCTIPENTLLQLPFTAIAGDVVLLETDLTTVSDVFRIFNNIFDTTAGTGLGNLAFLFSSDDSTPLPNPSTYSANVVFIQETSPFTHFNGNGTDYLLGAPEPGSFALIALGLAAVAYRSRMRLLRRP
jgi:hypothetical protein